MSSKPFGSSTTSDRTLLRSDFSLQKNQPHESIVPPFSQDALRLSCKSNALRRKRHKPFGATAPCKPFGLPRFYAKHGCTLSAAAPFSQKGTLGSVASALVTAHCRCRLFERNAPAALGIHFVRESSIKINCTVMRFIFLYTIFETLFC